MDNRSEQSIEGPPPARKIRAVLWLLLILAVVTAIRIRLLDFPLQRDEGEYAYAGQLLLQGVTPYEGAYNVALKLPGTCVAYALIMAVFGQTTIAIHAGVILVNLATAALVFVLARRLYGDAAGAVAAGTFALLSINPAILGLAAHATHFVMLLALAGIVLLQNLEDNTSAWRIFSAGLLLGLAVIMKQTGAAFGFFAAVWVAWCELSSGNRCGRRLFLRLSWLALGGVLPFVLMCGILALTGDFNRFWFWTIQYARAHTSISTFGWGTMLWMLECVWEQGKAAPGLWGLAVMGALLLFGKQSVPRRRFFIISFSLFSFLAVCPGWYFREHYFIQMLPAAGLLAAVAFDTISRILTRRKLPFPPTMVPSAIFAVAVAGALIQWRNIFFFLTPVQACRAIYAASPFPEAVEISRYLASHCAPDARILVMGSEPEIYFYSHRRSATGYICTYPLMEPQPYAAAMQDEMIREIERANPAYVVFVNIHTSWQQSLTFTNTSIFAWFDQYRQKHLQLVGVTEILPDHPTEYRWLGPENAGIEPHSAFWLAIFKSRDAVENQSPPAR
jgi:hypothetical protein